MKKYLYLTILLFAILLFTISCGISPNLNDFDNNAYKNLINENTSYDLFSELLPIGINNDIIESDRNEPNDLPSESLPDIHYNYTSDEIADSNNEQIPFTGEIWCSVHFEEYHYIPSHYSDYVGEEKFQKWFEETSKLNLDEEGCPILEEGCPYPEGNIYEFIKYFNLSTEEFHDLWYYSGSYYTEDHNPDILFCDDKEFIEDYYRGDRIEHIQMMSVKESEYNFILDLFILYYDDPVYGEAFKSVVKNGYNRFSIPQLIYEADLPRKSVEEIYERIKTNPYSYGNYDYDFEMIYTQKEVIMEAMKTKTPEEINEIVRVNPIIKTEQDVK